MKTETAENMASRFADSPVENPGVAIYLFPVTLSDNQPVEQVLPGYNLALLKGIRHFVVENVRTARRFLRQCFRDFPIDDCTFEELSEHTPLSAVDAMLAPIAAGHAVGMLSEAGCPAVADPGAALVDTAQRKGIKVIPLVGPSSILLSLMASGLNGQQFAFRGYLPVDVHERAVALRNLEKRAKAGETQIFIETPYRNVRLVEQMLKTLSADTCLCIAVDITGPAQSIVTRTIAGWRKNPPDMAKIPAIFLLGQPAAHP